MWRRNSLALLCVSALLVFSAVPAAAHSKLVSSNPRDGAVLSAAPNNVTLTFDENLIEELDNVSIIDADGNVVQAQNVTPDGPRISVPWPATAGPGEYQVSYRVVSADGHPVMGAISFSITASESVNPTTSPSSSPTRSSALPAESMSSTGSVIPWLWLILVAVVIAGILAFITVKRQRRR